MSEPKQDTTAEKPLNLYQKLAKITGEVGKIDKTGQSSGYGDKYNFIEYGAVAGRLRELFAKYGVVIVPRMQQASKQQRVDVTSRNNAKGVAVLIDFSFSVVNADQPDDKFTVTWTGEAIDYGDKATNKAATAALKYYLMRQFNISEKGDDPDGASPDLGEHPKSKPTKSAAKQAEEPTPDAPATSPQKAKIFKMLTDAGVKRSAMNAVLTMSYDVADPENMTQLVAARAIADIEAHPPEVTE